MNPENLLKLNHLEMPFGKYKGTKLINLPESYVLWFNNNDLPKGELGNLLKELYEIKVNGLEDLVRSLVK